MRKIFITFLVVFSTVFSVFAQISREEKADYCLAEYERYKGIAPYAKAADQLSFAGNHLALLSKSLPYVFVRFAQLEYMDRYKVVFPNENDEYWHLYYVMQRLQGEGSYKVESTYQSHILYVKVGLRYIQYLKPEAIPAYLVQFMTVLERCPAYEVKPEYEKYYNLLQNKILEGDKEKMKDFVIAKAKELGSKYWMDAGLVGCLDSESEDYVKTCLTFAKNVDEAAAYALEGFIAEENGMPKEKVMRIYEKAAKANNVLGTILLVNLMDKKDLKKEMELLANVEKDEFFLRYGGAYEKAERLADSNNPAELKQVEELCQKTIEQSIFKEDRRNAKKLFNECQTKLALLQLQQQEDMIDPDDVLPSEYLALATGYDSLEGQEDKAMYFYRLAAEGGDLRSLCRVAIDDMYVGALDGDEEKVNKAANVMLENMDSRFIPFMLNAAVVVLYGLNGDDADEEKARSIYTRFVKKYNKQSNNSYVEKDFLCGGEYLPVKTPELEFYRIDDALYHYNAAVADEVAGDYEGAAYHYSWASTWGHPLGEVKADKMRELNYKKKQQHPQQ